MTDPARTAPARRHTMACQSCMPWWRCSRYTTRATAATGIRDERVSAGMPGFLLVPVRDVGSFESPGGARRAVPPGDVMQAPRDLLAGVARLVARRPAADVLGYPAGVRCRVRGVGAEPAFLGPQVIQAGGLVPGPPVAGRGHRVGQGLVGAA